MMQTSGNVRRDFGLKRRFSTTLRFGSGRIGVCLFSGAILLFLCSYVSGATIGGRFTTSLYSWERQGADGDGTGHLRAAQAAMLYLDRAGAPGLSFHTYVYLYGDVRAEEQDDPRLKVYHTYVDWKRAVGALDVRFGRQLVYEGVGHGTIDGLWLGYDFGDLLQIAGYAGSLPSLEASNGLQSWSDGHMIGATLRIRRIYGTTVRVSFVRKARQPVAYQSHYSGKTIENSALQQQWVGIDLRRRFGRVVDLFGRLDIDTMFEKIRRAELIARYTMSPSLRLTGEFIHRVPTIDLNSIFSVFAQETNQQVRLSGTYRINKQVSVFSGVEHVLYDGDTATRVRIGVFFRGNTIAYSRGMGYMGARDGVSGGLRYPVGDKLWIKANAQFAQVALFDGAEDKDEVVTASMGVNYRPTRGTSFDLEGQSVQNKVYKRDFRIFFRGSVWFFQGERKKR